MEEELLGRKINLLERGNQMFNKEQVQKAIKEIDDNLASLSGPRQAHVALANDIKLVQAVCMDYFEGKEAVKAAPEKKDVGTNEPIEHTKPGDTDK